MWYDINTRARYNIYTMVVNVARNNAEDETRNTSDQRLTILWEAIVFLLETAPDEPRAPEPPLKQRTKQNKRTQSSGGGRTDQQQMELAFIL